MLVCFELFFLFFSAFSVFFFFWKSETAACIANRRSAHSYEATPERAHKHFVELFVNHWPEQIQKTFFFILRTVAQQRSDQNKIATLNVHHTNVTASNIWKSYTMIN